MPISVRLTDGIDDSSLTPEGWLNVKTNTPEDCYAADFTGAQTATVILTPTAGKKLKIRTVYVSTETTTTDITLKFTTSGDIFFKLYTAQKASQTGNEICATGAIDETINLTCGAKTFISIGYDEL